MRQDALLCRAVCGTCLAARRPMEETWTRAFARLQGRFPRELPKSALPPLQTAFNLRGATSIQEFFELANDEFTKTKPEASLVTLLRTLNVSFASLDVVVSLNDEVIKHFPDVAPYIKGMPDEGDSKEQRAAQRQSPAPWWPRQASTLLRFLWQLCSRLLYLVVSAMTLIIRFLPRRNNLFAVFVLVGYATVLVISHGWAYSAPPSLPSSPAPLSQPLPESTGRNVNTAANVEPEPTSPSSTSKVLIRMDTHSHPSSDVPGFRTPFISSTIALFANNDSIVCHATFSLPDSDSWQYGCGTIQGKAYNKAGSVVFNCPCLSRCLHERFFSYRGFLAKPKLHDTLTEVWVIHPRIASEIERLEVVHGSGMC